MQYYFFDTTTSTNDEARLIAESETSAVIIAKEQTQGRGRQGNSFYSPRGMGLYMSYLLSIPPQKAFEMHITPLCAVAVCRALSFFGIGGTEIKWVNDIYYKGKKVCGILVEGCGDKIICGIGINLSTQSFPEGLPLAGSVGSNVAPDVLARRIVFEMDGLLLSSDFFDEYKSRSCLLGREITFSENGEIKKALAVDIDDECRLVIKTPQGLRSLAGGEVKIIMD